jgi:endonuclease/exonuclease/phosphatase family metal-dependent hydrolase
MGRIITVASYNIHKGEGIDRRVDLARIARVLREVGADLVGIQEIYRPQAEALAVELGMSMGIGVTRHFGGIPYGNAILTRYPVQDSHAFDLTRPPREPRGGLRLDIVVGEDLLHLFNVHFGLKIRERAEQVETLVQEQILRHDLSGSRVVIGDLNEWFPGAVGRALRRELHGPRIRRTHPAPLPLFPLDRIYWDRTLRAESFHVHRSHLARVASDHLPVVARLSLAPSRAKARAGR